MEKINLKVIKIEQKQDKKASSTPWKIDQVGTVVDDAQSYGYKSFKAAQKAMWYKFKNGKEKSDSLKTEASNFWKTNKKIQKYVQNIYECCFKEFARGETTDDDLFTQIKSEFNVDINKKYLKYV